MAEKKVNSEAKWFYPAIILLSLFFLFKLVNQSQIIWQFPLDQNNDISVHLGQLHFLKQYGFHQNVPNWYNGYSLFLNYPILWYFLTLPLYIVLKNILLATFISHILLYVLGLLFFILIGKILKISFYKIFFFYLAFYANPVAVGNFIKLGRMTELTGMTLFIAFFALLLYLKDKPIKPRWIAALAVIFAGILLAHPSWIILSAIIIPPFFLLKYKKDKIKFVLAMSASLLLASFWLFPFIFTANASSLESFYGTARLFDFKNFLYDNIVSFVLPISMWLTAFFYFRNVKITEDWRFKKELIFYSGIIIASVLYISRLIFYIPILNRPYPDSYNMFFIFFTFLFLIRTPFNAYGKLAKLLKLSLLLLPIIFILASVITVPNFRGNNPVDNEIKSLLSNLEINDKFLIENVPYPTSSLAFYSYAAIYYNLSTPSGWVIQGADSKYFDLLYAVREDLRTKNCQNLLNNLHSLNATKLIVSNALQMDMPNCSLKILAQERDISLFSIP
ncbi:MAG: hypothetical protein V1886_02970 [archaeon]